MTGELFRWIRESNKITQRQILGQISYSWRGLIQKIEKSAFVPERFVKALGFLVGIDLLNPEVLKRNEEGFQIEKERMKRDLEELSKTGSFLY